MEHSFFGRDDGDESHTKGMRDCMEKMTSGRVSTYELNVVSEATKDAHKKLAAQQKVIEQLKADNAATHARMEEHEHKMQAMLDMPTFKSAMAAAHKETLHRIIKGLEIGVSDIDAALPELEGTKETRDDKSVMLQNAPASTTSGVAADEGINIAAQTKEQRIERCERNLAALKVELKAFSSICNGSEAVKKTAHFHSVIDETSIGLSAVEKVVIKLPEVERGLTAGKSLSQNTHGRLQGQFRR